MILSVIAGVLVGFLAFVPLFVSLKFAKKVTPVSNISYGALSMLGIFVSMLVLFLSVIIVYFNFKENIVPFVISCAITLAVSAIVYGIYITVSRVNYKNEINKNNDTNIENKK